jgi:NAD dependent epimerase/dehydratase family enzyme
MKIVSPSGTGQIGTILSRAFQQLGYEVVVICRHPAAARWRTVPWDGATLGPWAAELDGADVVINLAGRSVNCRYTPTNRRIILESRTTSTRIVGMAIAGATHPPRLWLQASTAMIYAHRYDAPNDEASGILGGAEPGVPETWRFSVEVAAAWERELQNALTLQTRKVALRSAITMSPDRGGIFDTLLGLVRVGLG